ncbi:MAG TPA: DUF2239 family protein, partial [Phenylobacterium sp.]
MPVLDPTSSFTAFHGHVRLASGPAGDVALAVKAAQEQGATHLFVFEDATGQPVDFDLRGSPADVAARYAAVEPATRRGRPKLGVVSREVTLLPRHWDWL